MKDKESGKRKRPTTKKHKKPQNQEPLQSKHTKKDNTHDHQQKPSTPAKLPKLSSFLDKMKARLSGGHFRMINEKL